MRAMDEWMVRFEISLRGRSPQKDIDRLLDEAIEWVEARSLGLGGGFGPARTPGGEPVERWGFRGGICVQMEGATIPETQAMEFLEFLRLTCEARGLGVEGKVEPFDP